MLPKQQTKDARYKPIDTEKPYTKKHLKAGDTKLALPHFWLLTERILLTSWRGVVDYASEKAS